MRKLPLLLLPTILALPPSGAAQVQGNGGASLGVTQTTLSFSDSAWSRRTQLGVRLRLGLWDLVPARRIALVPDVEVGATSVGGVDPDAPFAYSEGEIGLSLRIEPPLVRPYLRAGVPVWRTVEVERSQGAGRERRDYIERGLHFSRPSLEAGAFFPVCRTGAGPELSYSWLRGLATRVESVYRAPQGEPVYPPVKSVREPFRAVHWTLSWSGPFSIARPFSGRFC